MKYKQTLSPERLAIKGDSEHPLMKATNAQIDTYVDNNVTNLAEARVMFKTMLRLQRNMMQRLAKISVH